MLLIVNSLVVLTISIFLILKKRDLVFVTYSLLYLAYVHVAPSIVAMETSREFDYITIQLIFFIFFYLPFYFLYDNFKFNFRSVWFFSRRKSLKGTNFLYNFILLIMPFLILFILIKNNLVYRRLGVGLIDAVVALPLFDKIIIKMFDWYSIFIVTSIYVLTVIKKELTYKIQFYNWALLCFSIFLINSKLNLIILFVMFFIAKSIYSRLAFKFKYFFLILLFLFFGKVTNDVRYSIYFNQSGLHFDTGVFSDRVTKFNENVYNENENIAYRLNGVVLAADLFDKVGFFNFDLGYFDHIYNMSFIGNKEYLMNSKLNGITAGKIYLQSKYLNDSTPDNYSCILTDVYGATGILGLLTLALLIAFTLKVSSIFIYSRNFHLEIVGIYIYSIFIFFEMDIVTNINKIVLLILPLIVILSFTKDKPVFDVEKN